MKTVAIPLNVPEMDRDHAEIEALLASVSSTNDADLSWLLETVAREIEAHFAREEAMMAQKQGPVLECHKAQHAMILREIAAMLRLSLEVDASTIRKLLAVILPALIDAHVGSVDGIVAEFLNGRMSCGDFQHFRLPDNDKAR